MSPRGRASRVPGCQRILKRLRAVRVHVDRAQGVRDETIEQKAWLREVADALDRVIRTGATLPGAAAVDARAARTVRKRAELAEFHPGDRWAVGVYER
jgi:hypothetical protein